MGEFLPELDIDIPERQRRLTVLLRLILLIPQDIVLFFLSIAAGVVMVLGWFGALFLGRLPYWAADFLGGYLAYHIRVYAYSFLLVDRYPPFRWRPENYPVVIRLQPGRLNRLAVFFRFILVIPAAIVVDVVTAGWAVLSFFIWLIVLILGRTPKPIAGAGYALLRYLFRTEAYFMLLTGAYPKRLFGDDPNQPATPEHRPLVLSEGARAMLVVFIVLGVLSSVTSAVESRYMNNTQTASGLSGR
jgi:ABC-type multidrug transport system fused ATPase/permease subunit